MADSDSNNLGLTLSDLEFVVEETGCAFLGDVNDDGALNVVDIVGIVNAILS